MFDLDDDSTSMTVTISADLAQKFLEDTAAICLDCPLKWPVYPWIQDELTPERPPCFRKSLTVPQTDLADWCRQNQRTLCDELSTVYHGEFPRLLSLIVSQKQVRTECPNGRPNCSVGHFRTEYHITPRQLAFRERINAHTIPWAELVSKWQYL